MHKNYINMSKTIFVYYFIVPIGLGLLLTQVFKVDISGMAKEYIGMFSFFDKSGLEINSKAMIAFISLFFIPSLWKYCRSLPVNIDNLKAMSALKLFAVAGFSVLMVISIFVFFLTDISYDSLSYKPRSIRFLLSISQSDILFGFLFLVVLFAVIYFANVAIVFMAELYGRTKK